MKITIITVVYNAEQHLRDCIESVLGQDYEDLEYVLIDGKSTDRTYHIAKEYEERISVLVSEPDQGMYDALNKGIALATGEVIGILNADDILASSDVITELVKKFKVLDVDAVYGDLNYVAPNDINKIQRKWRSSSACPKDLALGWMPAHPTLYVKAGLFSQLGAYKLNYGSAADYELMLRYFYKHQITTAYLPKLMVNMRSGGMSNQSAKHRYAAFLNDYAALKQNNVPMPLMALLLKKLRKIRQFF
ncbi:glycosyltransferase family 2 protein [Pedobacter xixiisoli]|uniref:Glycosyl transferase family 2 n=1 Tax=Pedobacter xixiisoli TaxID=1476464 RepID=A0A286A9T3_9SPHI|nr:glycosyltransferase family 2 protein [Pedobacter xixiisoli]SOD18678.1 Glycosyl transferase family 2 [Pedobacter xixiisoli]